MAEDAKAANAGTKAPKDRSPSFPFIGLPTAIERLEAYEAKFGRHPTPANKAGLAWGMKEASSQAAQTLAALKSFGMIDYQGSGPARLANITDDGRNYLRAQQDSVKEAIVRRLAMKPKAIAKYWSEWGHPRPIDEVCLDELVLNAAFTQSAAETFLRVYDATVAYAGLTDSDKESDVDSGMGGKVESPNQRPAVGDLVRVEAGGQVIFEKVAVRAVQEQDGQVWVFIEGTETGQKVEQVTVVNKAPETVTPPPVLPLASGRDEKPLEGEEMDRFTVDEGVVKITFPSGMTIASVDELEQFFDLFIKKAKRRAGAEKKPN